MSGRSWLVGILLVAAFLAACGADHEQAAHEKMPSRHAAVPGVEIALVTTEPMRDAVRAFGVVAADVELADLRDAQAELARAEAKQRLAAQQVRRLEELTPGGIAPRKELEAARAEEASAAADAARATKALAAFGRDRPHEPLGADEAWVIAQVRQMDLGSLGAGFEATFVADAFANRPFAARVDAPASYVDPATRAAPVRLRVKDAAHVLRPGMTGTVVIEVGAPHDAVVVPAAAVVYDDAQPVVFVAEADDRFELRPVRLGIVRGERIEIAGGIEPGVRVAVTGTASLLSATRLPPAGEAE